MDTIKNIKKSTLVILLLICAILILVGNREIFVDTIGKGNISVYNTDKEEYFNIIIRDVGQMRIKNNYYTNCVKVIKYTVPEKFEYDKEYELKNIVNGTTYDVFSLFTENGQEEVKQIFSGIDFRKYTIKATLTTNNIVEYYLRRGHDDHIYSDKKKQEQLSILEYFY